MILVPPVFMRKAPFKSRPRRRNSASQSWLEQSPSVRRDARWPETRTELAAIVEYSNDAIFSRTFDGTIKTWNAAAERIFGYTAVEIIGCSSRVLLPRGHRDELRQLVAQMRRGQVVEHFETERRRKDGRLVHMSLTLSPVRDGSGRLVGFSTIARDTSAQRQMRDALARRERELEDLFEEASVALVMVARNGKVLRANKAFGELVGLPARQIAGRSLTSFHPNIALARDLLRRLAQRQTLHNFPTEVRSGKSGTKSVLVDANAFWQGGDFMHSRWFLRDISQRKRLEIELLNISERERRTFAQELHDGLGQQLGGIAYLCNVLRERLRERGAPEAEDARRVSDLMREAIEQARRVARGLSPIQPEPEGLMNALRELALQTKSLFGLHSVFKCPRPAPVYDAELAAHLFRIAQEAVNNALKHAKPRLISIRLTRDRGEQRARHRHALCRHQAIEKDVQRQQHQTDADHDPAQVAGPRSTAALECDHTRQQQQWSHGGDIERQDLNHQRGADIGAEHDGKRGREFQGAAGNE